MPWPPFPCIHARCVSTRQFVGFLKTAAIYFTFIDLFMDVSIYNPYSLLVQDGVDADAPCQIGCE